MRGKFFYILRPYEARPVLKILPFLSPGGAARHFNNVTDATGAIAEGAIALHLASVDRINVYFITGDRARALRAIVVPGALTGAAFP